MARLTEKGSKKDVNEVGEIGLEQVSKSPEPSSPEALKCKKILKVDKAIRFAGICSSDGKILAAEYKRGINPLFNNMDLEFSVTRAAIKALERNMTGTKLGQMFYSITAYENVKRATFTLDDGGFLLVSFERNGNESDIIKKVIYDVGLH